MNRSVWVLGVLAGCVLAHSCRVLAAVPQPRVKTAQGEAVGKWIESGAEKAFLGLPHAAPPVGELRWKALGRRPRGRECATRRTSAPAASSGTSGTTIFFSITVRVRIVFT